MTVRSANTSPSALASKAMVLLQLQIFIVLVSNRHLAARGAISNVPSNLHSCNLKTIISQNPLNAQSNYAFFAPSGSLPSNCDICSQLLFEIVACVTGSTASTASDAAFCAGSACAFAGCIGVGWAGSLKM